jgi:hypothetical protein
MGIIKLGSPKYVYEVELVNGNQIAEIEVNCEGKVIEFSKWRVSLRDLMVKSHLSCHKP